MQNNNASALIMANPTMGNSMRGTAIMVGALYILGTVSGVFSMVAMGSLLNTPLDLGNVAANPTAIKLGALLVLLMGLALAVIPVLMYPILSKQSKPMAMGYVVFRGALETTTYLITVLAYLYLGTVSQAYVAAGAEAASVFSALASILANTTMIHCITTFVFIIGAVIFYSTLHQTRLIPRWLSGWGLVATIPYLAAGLLTLFGAVEDKSTLQVLLYMPLAVQEMVLGGWLIVKGFKADALERLMAA